jgi:UDP-N-acetylmuramoyl-L-alanyl-D-glutamate--2,6-diaminopimelate ligase
MTSYRPRGNARVSSSPVVPSLPRTPLADVAVAVPGAETHGATAVSDVALDSRDVAKGALFFCVKGDNTDGHAFAAEAVAAGAAGLVVERWLDDVAVPQVRVPSVRDAMGPMSAAVFGHPAASMAMVGVTGTNGKTTTTFLLEAVFLAAGIAPGVIGTNGARIAGEAEPLARTTPEAPDLQRLLAKMRASGVGGVAMEVSSHALAQRRVDGVRFDVAVFTNLSQDHLDYHGTMERYFSSKQQLFSPQLTQRGLVNADDPWGRRLLVEPTIPITTYAVDGPAELRATDVVSTGDGSAFSIGGARVESRLRGRFNVSNCLGTYAAARALDIDEDAIVRGIAGLAGVPGRFEPVEADQDFLVVVDYAHTPDSIRGVLQAARPLASGRVIVVFGCGGDRDSVKRPLMGAAATEVADLTVITSDNPRSEDPLAIIAQVEQGASAREDGRGGDYVIEADRRSAIRLALREARRGDVVVIAGKGHETYQELASGTIPFDDREVARRELLAMRAGA